MTKPTARFLADFDNDLFPCAEARPGDELSTMHSLLTPVSSDTSLENLHWALEFHSAKAHYTGHVAARCPYSTCETFPGGYRPSEAGRDLLLRWNNKSNRIH